MTENDHSLDAGLANAPFNVQQCATGGQTYYYHGACLAKGSYDCPFQAKQERVVLDGTKFVACKRYHPHFQGGLPQV